MSLYQFKDPSYNNFYYDATHNRVWFATRKTAVPLKWEHDHKTLSQVVVLKQGGRRECLSYDRIIKMVDFKNALL